MRVISDSFPVCEWRAEEVEEAVLITEASPSCQKQGVRPEALASFEPRRLAGANSGEGNRMWQILRLAHQVLI